MKKIMIILIMLAAIFSVTNVSASITGTVVVKNCQTLTIYIQSTYDNGESEISSSTCTNADVSTLASIGIPVDAWPLFANNKNLLFSTEAFVLEREKKEVEAKLETTSTDLYQTRRNADTWRFLFWIVSIIGIIVIAILKIKLYEAKKHR